MKNFWVTLAAVAIANFFVWCVLEMFIGGDALMGEFTGHEFLLRRQPQDSGISVSEAWWIVSLVHSSLTVGLTPLLLTLAFTFGRPSWDRGLLDWVLLATSLAWLLAVCMLAASRFSEWIAM